ncbi:DUF4917 domain-containing protein [Dehalogenimonas etheniformans]|uniref:DUF4917 domain-containing protein n=2 Tax=Dehalogenimonas etheniformans TaxID=1536648 RepID=A0A2P5P5M6_9CHLR|nr:DUF4917 domain-containing protein [Dehalogenimonas etheniformans]
MYLALHTLSREDVGLFETDYDFLRQTRGEDEEKVVLVFYPHGNLAISRSIFGDEQKVSRDGVSLLENVLRHWVESDHIPVFVSEGSSTDKLRSIKRSHYLGSVYNDLKQIKGNIVFYGWSASDQDKHIFEALDHSGIDKIAFSVFKGGQPSKFIHHVCDTLSDYSHLKHIKPDFLILRVKEAGFGGSIFYHKDINHPTSKSAATFLQPI